MSDEWKRIGIMEIEMLLSTSLNTILLKYFSMDVSLEQKKQKAGVRK